MTPAKTWQLLAARLILDAQHLRWSPDQERPPRPHVAFQKHELPSPYGERYPWPVAPECVARWEAATGRRAVVRSWEVDGLGMPIIFVLELGRGWHVLAQSELKALGWSQAKLEHDALRALFYQSYKVRPATTHDTPHATVKVFETKEGLGSARLLLLPEFDLDAAKAYGLAAAPSRDHMVIAQGKTDDPANTRLALTQLCEAISARATFPLQTRVLKLHATLASPLAAGAAPEA